MPASRIRSAGTAATLAAGVVVVALAGSRARAATDPIAIEIERWSAFVTSNPATDEIWTQIKDGRAAALGRAAEALRAGRRLLALQRLAYARALGERPSLGTPAVRALGPELDALDAEMLAVYRPPLSIDKHPQFITASSLLKEARELDTAGLRYGALLCYLQAAYRFAPMRTTPPTLGEAALAVELGRARERLDTGGVDHSLGRLFLETAQSEASTPSGAANAAAIVADVLPRYFRALEPARPPPPLPPPTVTITLVRWPYT